MDQCAAAERASPLRIVKMDPRGADLSAKQLHEQDIDDDNTALEAIVQREEEEVMEASARVLGIAELFEQILLRLDSDDISGLWKARHISTTFRDTIEGHEILAERLFQCVPHVEPQGEIQGSEWADLSIVYNPVFGWKADDPYGHNELEHFSTLNKPLTTSGLKFHVNITRARWPGELLGGHLTAWLDDSPSQTEQALNETISHPAFDAYITNPAILTHIAVFADLPIGKNRWVAKVTIKFRVRPCTLRQIMLAIKHVYLDNEWSEEEVIHEQRIKWFWYGRSALEEDEEVEEANQVIISKIFYRLNLWSDCDYDR